MAKKSKAHKVGWLNFLEGNIPVAAAAGLPPGVLIAFGRSDLGAPLWPVIFIMPVLVALALAFNHRVSWIRRGKRWLDVGLAATLGVVLTLLEAPWRPTYVSSTFWLHTWGMGIGGAITAGWVSMGYMLALKLKKRGPYKKLVRGGPTMVSIFSLLIGFGFGFLVAPFSLFLWTTGVAELGPSFLPTPVFITVITAIFFALLCLPLSWYSGARR